MAGKRKTPKLRFDGRYYVVNFYRPDGNRSMISFGPEGERTEGEVLTAFGKWLDLFNQVPHKVLSYDSPYEAIEEITNPSPRINVGELLDYYHSWANKTLPPLEGKRQQDVIVRTERVKNFMEEYLQWPVENFMALAGSLISDHGYKVIVLGDENDRDLGHQIKTEVGAGCEDLTGKTAIPNVAVLA